VRVGPEDPVERLRGVGPKTARAFAEVGVTRVVHLLLWLPSRYQDRRSIRPLASITEADQWVLVRAHLLDIRSPRRWRRRLSMVQAVAEDGGGRLPVAWFNHPWMADRLEEDREYLLFGAVRTARSGGLQLVNPEVDDAASEGEAPGLVPVYRRCGPMAGRRLRRLVGAAMGAIEALDDPLPEELVREHDLPSLAEALENLHRPANVPPGEVGEDQVELLNRGRSRFHRRLAFDELLATACAVTAFRARRRQQEAPTCGPPVAPERVEELLPFTLTGAQSKVLGEIAADLRQPVPMARLLQGDVGCGKTAVAALAALQVLESGHQVAVMAPTELLAEQHHRSFGELLAGTSFRPRLLSSSRPARELRELRLELQSGSAALVVGTHALIQPAVEYQALGLAVVDEQHRFGVAQRQALLDKGRAPHLLVMTATPIPRTLTMTLYGDLDLSIIDELPPGRRPVRTVIRSAPARPRLVAFLRKEIASGGRAFIVYPLIDPSTKVAARALEEHREEMRRALGDVRVGVLHGRVSRDDREVVYGQFRSGEIQVLLATTVVEVGVDVPEATVMVVESADRFGLAQLHQLRGRVGRGDRPSWCVLMVEEEVAPEALGRLEVFAATSDGFEIAEADLRLRGPGELTGARQWGHSQLRFSDLVSDARLIEVTRSVARRLDESGRLPSVSAALGRYYSVAPEVGSG